VADRHRRASGRPGNARPAPVRAPSLRLLHDRHASPLAASTVQHHLDLLGILREEALHALDQRGAVRTDEDLETTADRAAPDPERNASKSSG